MIELTNLTKRFGPLAAVDGVSLSFEAGTIVGLVGENGAGKTTLMRIVAGELPPDAGTLLVDGKPVRFRSARDAAARGIEMVRQHFMLVPELTIGENLALPSSPPLAFWSSRAVHAAAEQTISASGIELRAVRRRVADLSVGEKAKLELIKALARRPRFLILDEPTSVLTPAETAELFAVMRRLAAAGTGIIFISHKLPEVLEATGRVVVMRRGRVHFDGLTRDSDLATLVAAMVESSAAPMKAVSPPGPAGTPVLKIQNLCTKPQDHAIALDGIDLDLAAGEIAAIAGVAGNGQTELAEVLRGLREPSNGEVATSTTSPLRKRRQAAALQGALHALNTHALLRASHIAHIPADRTRDGIVAEMSIAENLALAAPRWHPGAARRHAEEQIRFFSIRARSPEQPVGSLSGGNQQKVILARELGRQP
jgi:general nucleoside transport system ATP-binding protein